MNIFAGVCALILSTFIGYMISQKYRLKKSFYLSLSDFNKNMITEIGFYQKTLLKVFSDYKANGDLINCVKEYIINGNLNLNQKYLSTDDVEFVNKYLKELDCGDKELLLKHFSLYENLIMDKLKSADEEDKKYRSLLLKLGFLIGLILFIIFI